REDVGVAALFDGEAVRRGRDAGALPDREPVDGSVARILGIVEPQTEVRLIPVNVHLTTAAPRASGLFPVGLAGVDRDEHPRALDEGVVVFVPDQARVDGELQEVLVRGTTGESVGC